jgi:hypothetical protein
VVVDLDLDEVRAADLGAQRQAPLTTMSASSMPRRR